MQFSDSLLEANYEAKGQCGKLATVKDWRPTFQAIRLDHRFHCEKELKLEMWVFESFTVIH